MIRELLDLAQKLEREGKLPPLGYRTYGTKNPIRWVIHILPEGDLWLEEVEPSVTIRPTRDDRSGTVTQTNVKPYAFVDEARYALGISQPGREKVTRVMHEAFLRILEEAFKATGDRDFELVRDTLRKEIPSSILSRIQPNDIVTFAIGRCGRPIFEKESAKEFWRSYLERVNSEASLSQCAICGKELPPVTKLSTDVVVRGQKCKLTSFNKEAFTSYGKRQTANASICYKCGTRAALSLNYLLKADSHTQTLITPTTRGDQRPLEVHVAVFWLKDDLRLRIEGTELTLTELLSAPIGSRAEPYPTLRLLRELLNVPWRGSASPLMLEGNSFYLAVVSANKGRLVVRDWIAAPVMSLKDSLSHFIQGVSIMTPAGKVETFSIRDIVRAVDGNQTQLVRSLVRTAYRGESPAPAVLASCIVRLKTPKLRGSAGAIVACVKLCLSFILGKEVASMTQLDAERESLPYLCGRLLAILEQIQKRASRQRLDTTIADRYYGSASTSPATIFGMLIRLTQTAHLPKIRKEGKGYGEMKRLLEEVLTRIHSSGGFPTVLKLAEQAEFALGFYQQQVASYRKAYTNETARDQSL